MATGIKTFRILSFLFGGGCLVFLIVSFASDRWVVSTEKEVAGFKNLGLWSACFAKFRPPGWVLINKYYDGCWWFFDREMDDLRFYLVPPWFVATQVLVTLSLVFQLFAIIIMIVNAIKCFPHSRFKEAIALGLSSAAATLHGLTAVLLTVAVIMFGARADNERTWLERPDQNYLSWSFGMCVLAAFLAVLAFMTFSLESYRLWLMRKNAEEPEELFTTGPTSAQYNSKRSQQTYQNSRFSNHEASLKMMPLDRSTVVGAGDTYHLSELNGSRQRDRTNGYVPRQFSPPPVFQGGRSFDSKSFGDSSDSRHTQPVSTVSSKQSSSIPPKVDEDSRDYEDSKKIKQPVLPEYVPKAKPEKKDPDSSSSESYSSGTNLNDDSDIEKDHSRPQKSRASSEGKKSAKSLTNSKKRKDKKHADSSSAKQSEKIKSKKNDTLVDEQSRSRLHSKKSTSSTRRSSHSRERSSSRHQSHSRDRSSSCHRSRSRDLNSSCTEYSSDSDSVSATSRSRQKHRKDKESSKKKKNRSRHPSSEECIQKNKHEHTTSRMGSSKKKRHRSYTDDISDNESNSKQTSKRKGDKAKSLGEKRSKSQDFLETESLRSKQSKRGGSKPQSAYSSFYE